MRFALIATVIIIAISLLVGLIVLYARQPELSVRATSLGLNGDAIILKFDHPLPDGRDVLLIYPGRAINEWLILAPEGARFLTHHRRSVFGRWYPLWEQRLGWRPGA